MTERVQPLVWPGPNGLLAPGSTVGILGGGQLGRMLAVAATRLGLKTAVYAGESETPAAEVAGLFRRGDYQDPDGLAWLAEVSDVITYEFENVPVAAAEWLNQQRPVRPGPRALAVAQDRLAEKRFLSEIGLPVADYLAVETVEDLVAAMASFSGPALLKTRRLGYDGKGQVPCGPGDDASACFEAIGAAPAILERKVAFAGELSVIAVRRLSGDVATYDVPRNAHSGGILRRSTVPGGFPGEIEAGAREMAARAAEALNYVGVIAVEFFYLEAGESLGAGRLLINEIAPRVHNSGHWTMDAGCCDQFENHIRAICGWPTGPTSRSRDVEMQNLIGDDALSWMALAAEPEARLHLYGKQDIRAGRKMGHVNWVRS